ncbi:hypothetical protein [Halomicrococcus gelatinilyticus]|uniref:hypothetical protein n=1 Tax=Halomicrococcus gelatinilyticus TaxID=1702103 RepID=UPI002E162B66
MQVRDAVEADGGRLADLADVPSEVMGNVVHDRTVRVAETDDDIEGFVGFDAHRDAVHVTHLYGSQAARERLLDEPVRFAACEEMAVELLVPDDEDESVSAAKSTGFENVGPGPRFDGRPTERFRLENPTRE